MEQPQIPGYYFDPEKKKYFKIQRARDAPDVKYTREKLAKQEKKEREEKLAAERLQKRRLQTVIRPHTNSLLDRELGLRSGSHNVRTIWPSATTTGFQPQMVVSDASVRYFDRDPISKTLYVVNGETTVQRRRPDPVPPTKNRTDDQNNDNSKAAYNYYPWDILTQMTSPVSSLNYLPGSGALCVTTAGSDRSPVIYLADPDRDGPYLGEMYTPRHCTTIWGSAARPISFSSLSPANSVPATSTEHVAVGASSALMLLSRTNCGAWETRTPLKLESDILTLEWLSESILAFGCRNGKIHIHDTRAGGEEQILRHPYPISRLRRADDFTRLVCSGLDNTCVLYDMRMARAQTRSPQAPASDWPSQFMKNGRVVRYSDNEWNKMQRSGNFKRRKRVKYHHQKNQMWDVPSSQPLLHFQHDNPDDLELGLDVHPRLGLVAAAQDDARIRISNLWTGELVKEFDTKEDHGIVGGKAEKRTARIRCLSFIDDDGCGSVSLWASGEGALKRFGW